MHILFALQQPLPSRKAMTVTTLRDAAAHVRRGHRVTIAAPLSDSTEAIRRWYDLPPDVAFADVGASDTRSALVQWRLLRQVRRRDVDLVQTRLLSLALARPIKAALVYERHEFTSARRARLERPLVARPRTILLTNSRSTLAYFHEVGVGRDRDGAHALISAPPPVEEPIGEALPLRVHLIRANGSHDELLARLLDLDAVELHIFGELGRPGQPRIPNVFGRRSPMPPETLQRLAELPKVIEHGFLPPSELLPSLAQTHVGISVYPRGHGRTPVKTLDAMAAGCVVIASEIPDAQAEMVGESGILVPALDPDAVVSAVRRLRDDPRELARRRALARQQAAALSGDRRVAATLEALAAKTGERPGLD